MSFQRFTLLMIILALLTGVVSCIPSVDANDAPSDEPTSTSAITEDTELSELVRGNSEFAFDLYRTLAEEADSGGQKEENLFFSPYSLSLALAMTYAGARGQTETEMADTLHFMLPQEDLHPAFHALDLELTSRTEIVQDGGSIRLDIANSLWGQVGYRFLADFLDLIAENYGAGLKQVDFASDPEACRVMINDWVEEETQDKIEDLIPPRLLDELTTLVLVNAIYFKGTWVKQFNEDETTDADFTLLNRERVTVSMMRLKDDFRFADGDGYQAIELPYAGNKLAMNIILPHQGRFEEIEESLDRERVDEILDSLQEVELTVALPRFEMTQRFPLADTLTEMGMVSAFENADFSGMDGTGGLFISDVVHKAFVSVNEEGTEAAAASAVIVAREMSLTFRADRPFIVLIRDIENGTILFMGRVLDPTVSPENTA